MEMPELNKLVEKYENKDVVFLGLAINEKEMA
jgi:thiol-disulfide isomerase/thioredoxin